jgi:hypothetical protein
MAAGMMKPYRHWCIVPVIQRGSGAGVFSLVKHLLSRSEESLFRQLLFPAWPNFHFGGLTYEAKEIISTKDG